MRVVVLFFRYCWRSIGYIDCCCMRSDSFLSFQSDILLFPCFVILFFGFSYGITSKSWTYYMSPIPISFIIYSAHFFCSISKSIRTAMANLSRSIYNVCMTSRLGRLLPLYLLSKRNVSNQILFYSWIEAPRHGRACWPLVEWRQLDRTLIGKTESAAGANGRSWTRDTRGDSIDRLRVSVCLCVCLASYQPKRNKDTILNKWMMKKRTWRTWVYKDYLFIFYVIIITHLIKCVRIESGTRDPWWSFSVRLYRNWIPNGTSAIRHWKQSKSSFSEMNCLTIRMKRVWGVGGGMKSLEIFCLCQPWLRVARTVDSLQD